MNFTEFYQQKLKPKKQLPPTISELKKELDNLKVKRCIEKTQIYDDRIVELENKIDYLEYGVK